MSRHHLLRQLAGGIQRPRLRNDLVAQQSMYRLLGDEVDVASEELGELVLKVVDREAELGVGGENVEQVHIVVATRLTSSSGTKHCKFCEPVTSAHLSATRQVDLFPNENQGAVRRCSARISA